ncbi:hypothetical protein KPL71_021732 [Citrus sinensis]|uniref:Uncharacterized protein n=1 Tax=Citrus sinensis TaxID=2711 RepID=A0ACB8JHT8_CITSI|nr:hypothetical protein KPL71_021732 [Citrus sinensis]
MGFSISLTSTNVWCSHFQILKHPFVSFPVANLNFVKLSPQLCLAAAKSQSQSQTGTGGPVKKRSPNKMKKKKSRAEQTSLQDLSFNDVDVEILNDDENYPPTPLPKPPAGFVVDDTGRVLMASDKRIATIVDSTNGLPLDCVIRRVFSSSRGDECMLLCPVDTPVQILKSTNFDGWSAVSDDEVEAILPMAAFALAKIHMHLVHSGFCYTARGGFCYSEDDIFDFRTDDGQDIDGLPTEGVEITCFHLDGSHFMIYTPSDPLLFVAVKDGNGQLQIADDVSNLSHFMIGIVYDFSILFYKLYEGFDFIHNHRSKIASLGAN